MSAAAQSQRKGAARAEQSSKLESRLPGWYTNQVSGYTAVATEVMHHLIRVCTPVEAQIVLAIIENTIGDYQHQRPEFCQLTYDDLKDFGVNVSDVAISNALYALSDGKVNEETGEVEIEGKKLIGTRKKGNLREYRVLYENFSKAERRQPRKNEKLPVVAATGKRVNLGYGQPLMYEPTEPATTIEVVRRTNGELSLETEITAEGGRVKVSLFMPVQVADKPEGPGGEGLSVLKSPAPQAAARDLSSLKSLRELLEPVFLNLFEKKLDRPFLEQIAERLGNAPADALVRRIQLRRPAKSGMLLELANDVREVYEARDELQRTHAAPQPSAIPFEAEPETSQSVWARLRSRMKAVISEAEYGNWFRETRFESFHNGELAVHVPQQVCADFLEQEYDLALRSAAWELEIEVKRFRWIPQEAL